MKVKCVRRDTFTIVGFVPDRDAIASRHLAQREGSALVYVGKVGTGFSRTVAHDLLQKLQPLATPKPAAKPPMRDAKTVWVQPDFDVDVEYRAITGEGLLRHASYKGLARSKRRRSE